MPFFIGGEQLLCVVVDCQRKRVDNSCEVYSPEGQLFRHRMGYCPIPDAGPNKKVPVVQGAKIRAGQQKHKKV